MAPGVAPTLLLLSIAVASAPAPDAGPPRTGVEVARAEAEANAKTPAGRRYEGVVVSRVEDWLRPAIQRCARDLPKDELISFDGLVRVDAEGKAEEVLFGPETRLARCVAPEFRDAAYPRPPRPGWWVKVEIRPR